MLSDYDRAISTPPDDELCEESYRSTGLTFCERTEEPCPFDGDLSACIADSRPDHDD